MGDWEGDVDLAPRWALYVGTGGTTLRHAHLAHKLVVGLPEATSIDVVGVDPLAPCAWFVRGAREHEVRADGRVLLLFLDAGSFGEMTAGVEAILRDALPALVQAADAPDARIALVADLAARLPPVPDARLRRAASMLREEPGLEITDLAERLGISATRLSHLFAADLGFAPRKYRTWGTLRRALRLIRQGQPLTTIAHEAGFADAAHMSRAFSAMLGVPPSVIAGGAAIRLID